MLPLRSPTRSMRSATGVVRPWPASASVSERPSRTARVAAASCGVRPGQQAARHLECGHDRQAAAQQHADRAVQARELVELDLVADHRHPRRQAATAVRKPGRSTP